jgi:hypothetical protein
MGDGLSSWAALRSDSEHLLLVYSVPTSKLVPNTAGSQDSPVHSSRGVYVYSLVHLAQASFLQTNFGQHPHDDFTERSHNSKVVNTPGSQLKIQITLHIFEKIHVPFEACLLEPGKVV